MNPTKCKVDGCGRPAHSKEFCTAHYRRLQTWGEVREDQPLRPYGGEHRKWCDVEGCERIRVQGGLCNAHSKRLKKYGDVRADRPIEGREGFARRHLDNAGYVLEWVGVGRPMANTTGYARQHRLVMAGVLGRPLLPQERVHHVNGDRADNRAENLELWSTSQPPGQRVKDKLAWARELLETYEDLPPSLGGEVAEQTE